MKIQKSLLAVIAMAGTMGFSAVASAMDFSVYGSLRGGISQNEDGDTKTTEISDDTVAHVAANDAAANAVPTTDAGFIAGAAVLDDPDEAKGTDASLDLGHGAAGSRIGVRGSEDLGNGAEAGLHWEAGVTANGGLNTGRHANVWYSGAFGKVTIGQQNNPYFNAANWDQSWWLGGANRYGFPSTRTQGIRYDGEAGAFNFSVMATAGDTSAGFTDEVEGKNTLAASTEVAYIGTDADTNGANTDIDAYRVVTVERAEVEDETGIDSWIATGHYDMGVATINLGYRVNNVPSQELGEQYDNFVISANGTLDALDWYIAFEQNTDNADLKVTNAVTGTAADVDAADNAAAKALADSYTLQDATTIGLFLGYHLSDVSTLYFEWEDTANDGLDLAGENLDKTSTLLGFSRNIGPNTSFIAEYASRDYNSEGTADETRLLGFLKIDF